MSDENTLRRLSRILRQRLRERVNPPAGGTPTAGASAESRGEKETTVPASLQPSSGLTQAAAKLAGLRRGWTQERADSVANPIRSEKAQGPVVPLHEAVPGEVTKNVYGYFYRITRPIGELYEDATQIVQRLQRVFTRFPPRPELASFMRTPPERVLFLDIETTGLGNTPLFLIGVAYLQDRDLLTDLFLARDYSEERAVLGHLSELLPRFQALVTFNGATFDLPYIRNRQRHYGLPSLSVPFHLDLLPLARRRWQFGNCKLQTLERYVCGRVRTDDVPSAEIPAVYRRFVATGDGRLLQPIVYHNARDIVTLVELLTALAE